MMDVSSASAATSGFQQQIATREIQESERPRASDEAARASARQADARPPQETAQPERNEQARQTEPPRPVVNAQGQKTGSIINTTA
jgi:hypothetical protein